MSGFEGGRKALPLVLLAPFVLVWDRVSLYPYFEPKILVLDITVLILLSVFVFKRRIERSFSFFDLLVFCWIGFSGISLFFLPDFRIGICDLILRISAFFVFVILRWVEIETKELQKDTAVALLILAEIQAVFITGQRLFSLLSGFDAWDNRMLLGTLGFHTFAASFIGFCLVFASPLFKESSPKTQLLMAAVYIHCLLVLILLQCRAVFLALVAVAVINGLWFLIEREKNNALLKSIAKTFLVAVILVVVSTAIFYLTSEKTGGMWQRTKEDIFGEKLTGRRLIWRAAIEMVKEKPIAGFGIGGFYYSYIPFQGKILSQTNPKNFYPVREMVIWAHNDFLQEVVENGLAGLLLFLLTIQPFFYIIFKKRKELWARALALNLVFYFIVAFVDFPLHRPVEASLFMLLAAFSGRWIAEEKSRQIEIKKGSSALLILFALILTFFAFTDFCSKRIYSQGIAQPKEQLSKKEELLKKSLKWSLRKGQVQAAFGALLCDKGDLKEGAALMEEGLKTFRDVYIYENLAKSYFDMGDYHKSSEYYKKAMDGGINYISDGAMLAKTKMVLGERKEGWQILQNLFSLSKKNNALIKVLSGAYIEEKKYEEALKVIEGCNCADDLEILNLKAASLIKIGKFQEAEKTLSYALSLNKKYVPAIVNLGVVKMAQGDKKAAEENFRNALKLDPQNKSALTNLSIMEGRGDN